MVRYLLALSIPVLLGGCSQKEIDLGGFTFRCAGDSDCPSGQRCGVGETCVAIDGVQSPGGPEDGGDEDEFGCRQFCADLDASCPDGNGGGDDPDDDDGCSEVCVPLAGHFGVAALECIREKFEGGQEHCEGDGGDTLIAGCINMDEVCEQDSSCDRGQICEPFFCVEGERSACGEFLECLKDARRDPGDGTRIRDCFGDLPADSQGPAVATLGCEELCKNQGPGPGATAPCDAMGCETAEEACYDADPRDALCAHSVGCILMICQTIDAQCINACGQEEFEANGWASLQQCLLERCPGEGVDEVRSCLAGPCRDVARACAVELPVGEGGGNHQVTPCEDAYMCAANCGEDAGCFGGCARRLGDDDMDDYRALRQCADDRGCQSRDFECLDRDCGEAKERCFGGGGREHGEVPADVVDLFDQQCVGCHAGDTPPDLRANDIFDTTVNHRGNSCGRLDLVEPGEPHKSCLVQRMKRADETVMPPDGRLIDADIQIVEDWIRELPR